MMFSPGAMAVQGMGPADDFQVTRTNAPTYHPSVVKTGSAKEFSYSYQSAAFTGTDDFELSIASPHPITVQSLTPQALAFDGLKGGIVLPGSETARYRISSKYGSRDYTVRMIGNTTDPDPAKQASYQTTALAAGSLAQNAMATITTLLQGKSPGATSQDLFTSATRDFAAPAMTPNPTCFLAGVDLSAISFIREWNAGVADTGGPVTLISPRHAVSNAHSGVDVGKRITWRRTDGTFQTVTVASAWAGPPDLKVYYLSAPVTGVAPMKTLPANWRNYMPSSTDAGYAATKAYPNFPMVVRHVNPGQAGNSSTGTNIINTSSPHYRIFTCRGYGVDDGTGYWYSAEQRNWLFPAFSQGGYSGDSGGQVFALLTLGGNVTPVLVSSLYAAFAGPMYPELLGQIIAKMNSLAAAAGDGTTYTWQTLDLGTFESYAPW